MLKLAVAGVAGRMGRRIVALATEDSRFEVTAGLDAAGNPAMGQDIGEIAGVGPLKVAVREIADRPYDVLIDFSSPEGTAHWLDVCLEAKRPMVIGTTGLSDELLKAIGQASQSIPIVHAANMSVGINLLLKLVAQIARTLGDDYDIEIVESHHRFKKDAPSGTALALRDALLEATGRDADEDVIYGRQGLTGQRPTGQIGMHALRVGDTVGEHEVHFATLGETIIVRHCAHKRDTFVTGALRAADWLVDRSAGLYTMHDVLGF